MRKTNRIKRQLKSPRLLQERNKLIGIARADGFFNYEIADIFKISEEMISQSKVDEKNLKPKPWKNNS